MGALPGMGGVPGKKKATVAEVTFHRYDNDKSGDLSLAEVQALCEEKLRDRELLKEGVPVDPGQLMLLLKLIDRDHSGAISLEEFERWWQEGEKRWGVFQADASETAYLWSIVNFFEAFGPEQGTLADDGLKRMFLCVKGRGLVKRTFGGNERSFEDFINDVDLDFDGRVQLSEIMAWLKRETGPTPPKLPTTEECSRSVADVI